MKFKSTKKAVFATVSAVFMASVLIASPVVQDKGMTIGEEVSAVQATKIAKQTMQTTSNLNVRTAASLKGRWLVTIPKGTKVTTDTQMGSWFKVTYKGKTGYVSGAYLKKVSVATSPTAKTPTPAPAPKVTVFAEKTYSTTGNLNVRSSSSIKGKWLVTIPKGKQVKSNQTQNGWFKVTYGKKTGWVSGAYLKEVKVSSIKSVQKKTVASSTDTSQKLMSRSQVESHISKYVNNGFNLMSGTGRYSIIIEFPSSASGKAQMSVDGVNYISGVEIKPEDFGQKGYEDSKAHLALMDGAIQAYAESQFGVGSSESKTLSVEIKKMTLQGSNGDVKQITLQGKTVRIAKEGVRTRVAY